jgi:hypothetical protein
MSTLHPVRIFVENRAEELVMNGIFRDLIAQGYVQVKMTWTLSSALSLASLALLENPGYPVAIVANCKSELLAPDIRQPSERILSKASHSEAWHLALAIPDVTAWLAADSRFLAHLQQAERAFGQRNKHDMAVLFSEWALKHEISIEDISASFPEFHGLYEFVMRHVTSMPAAC